MKQKLGASKSTYRHNAQIGKYHTILPSKKKIQFWPSTHVIDESSFVKIASNSWQAEVIARSTSYQTPQTDKNSARNHSATKLLSGRSWPSIALKLLTLAFPSINGVTKATQHHLHRYDHPNSFGWAVCFNLWCVDFISGLSCCENEPLI